MSDKRYFGDPCIHGHGGERYLSSRECCECVADRVRRRRGTLPDKAVPQRRVAPRKQIAATLPVSSAADFIKSPSRAQLMAGK